MAKIKEAYAAVDIHGAHDGSLWPAVIPPITAPEAIRAARRLWRFALGATFTGSVVITTGNRRAARIGWEGNNRAMYVNPSKGWREVIHDLSHWFELLANGKSTHSKWHARFETKLVKEVIKRGWLEGALRDPEPKPVAAAPDPRVQKHARILARITAWERKEKRAANALKKLRKQSRYYERTLGEVVA